MAIPFLSDISGKSASFAGDVTLNTGTAKKLSILASTHNTNTANTSTLELGFGHSGGTGVGNIVLTEDANNSFGADMTFGVPHNNGSGGSSTRTALTLDGGTLSATFTGGVIAPYFTSIGGRSFKMDNVAFVGGYSDGSNANGANDLGSATNQWRDLYLSGDITSSAGGATFADEVNMASAKIESDGSAAAGAYLELHHNNNNTTDVCATINLTNNTGGYAAIVGGTTGANNTGYIEFKTDNAGTQGTVLTLNGDNSATFAGDVLVPSNNVGIGTMPSGGPQAALHVSGAFNTNAPTGNGVLMGLYNSTHGYIQLNGSSGSYIDFSVSGVDHKGRILYDNASNYMRFDTDGSEKLRIESNGNITLKQKGTIKYEENTDVDSAAAEAVASVVHGTHTAAFFDYVIKKGTNVRAGVVTACHDGTNVEYAETSTIDLGDTSDVTLSVDISGTLMRLIATTTSNDWSVKSLIRAI